MRRILNWLLVFSLFALLFLGIFLYSEYRRSQTMDTTLLELSNTLYQNPLTLKEGRVDDVAINYIFYMDQESEALKAVTVEVFHCKNIKMSYIDLPLDSEISIKENLYQKLIAINAKIPQYFKLDRIQSLFREEQWAAYAQVILDDMLEVDSSSYSVIYGTKDNFEKYLTKLTNHLNKKADINKLINEQYKIIETNLDINSKMQYLDYYARLKKSDIKFYEAEGSKHTDSFDIDLIQFRVLMSQLELGIK